MAAARDDCLFSSCSTPPPPQSPLLFQPTSTGIPEARVSDTFTVQPPPPQKKKKNQPKKPTHMKGTDNQCRQHETSLYTSSRNTLPSCSSQQVPAYRRHECLTRSPCSPPTHPPTHPSPNTQKGQTTSASGTRRVSLLIAQRPSPPLLFQPISTGIPEARVSDMFIVQPPHSPPATHIHTPNT